MNPIDERLFNLYCCPILRDAENFNAPALQKAISDFPLTESDRGGLLDVFWEYHYHWSLDAFAAGHHLGLSLGSDVRRGRPQQV